MKRLITGAVLTGLVWLGASWWATTLADPITAWGFALTATIGLWVVIVFTAIPHGDPLDSWDDGPHYWVQEPRHSPTQAELDAQHQRHLAEQARYMYLAGEHTPPTDWFPG